MFRTRGISPLERGGIPTSRDDGVCGERLKAQGKRLKVKRLIGSGLGNAQIIKH